MCIWYLLGSLLTVPWLLKVYVISLYIHISILLIFCIAYASKTFKICILYVRMFIHCTLADGKGGNCPISSLRLNRNENGSALFSIHFSRISQTWRHRWARESCITMQAWHFLPSLLCCVFLYFFLDGKH